MRPDGSGLAKITDVNREQLAEVQLGEPEQFQFEGANGDTVYAWAGQAGGLPGREEVPAGLHHPRRAAGLAPTTSSTTAGTRRPTPAPATPWSQIDFHGSTGYGQAFTDAIRKDWGGKPLVDLQKGLAAALERYPWIDGGRACALGASYGGFMINWIAGNWPDGFRCLVNHDGIFDQR